MGLVSWALAFDFVGVFLDIFSLENCRFISQSSSTIRGMWDIQNEGGTRVSCARFVTSQLYPARIGVRTIVEIVLNVLVYCITRMGDML